MADKKPVFNFSEKQAINLTEADRIHTGDTLYRLQNENRYRFLVWSYPVAGWVLIFIGLLIPETPEAGISQLKYSFIVTLALAVSIAGKIAANQLIDDVRINQDLKAATNQGRQQRYYDVSKTLPSDTPIVEPLDIPSFQNYISKVAHVWDTHLGLLSPTGTGKTTFLEAFLSAVTKRHKTLIIVVEPKTNPWAMIPSNNVFRIKATPDQETFLKVSRLVEFLLWIIEMRKNNKMKTDYKIVFIFEEYLTFFKQVKARIDAKSANVFDANFKALQNIGREILVQTISISQSPVASDIGYSGGERANMRLALLGSNTRGFEAIDRGIPNAQLVPSDQAEKLKVTYDILKPKLSEGQPLLMSNFIGGWSLVPVDRMSKGTLDIETEDLFKVFPQLPQVLSGQLKPDVNAGGFIPVSSQTDLDIDKFLDPFLENLIGDQNVTN